jgi:hypothetical protein
MHFLAANKHPAGKSLGEGSYAREAPNGAFHARVRYRLGVPEESRMTSSA